MSVFTDLRIRPKGKTPFPLLTCIGCPSLTTREIGVEDIVIPIPPAMNDPPLRLPPPPPPPLLPLELETVSLTVIIVVAVLVKLYESVTVSVTR